MKKIIAGLVVVVAAVGVIKVVSKEESPISQEVIEVDATDVSDNLYQDTFSDTDSKDEEAEKVDEKDEEEKLKEEQKQELDKLVESDLKEYEKEQESNQTKSASGQFEGFADGSFIEVKLGNTYDVFKVTDAVKSKLQSKSIGQNISFTYVSSAGQKVITSIN